ncbi:hypothetical protein L1987_25428 [Smallanthus sonchifolius]|uniref:Uncharacterized protein n=1 Tax=Smallanthus sonchifolius TaxID=185202 RepID=A0ACB9IMI7_9ASTR|nr:hypothetical protein L1987_25428 [Smallanthus sonchifolius]
MLGVFTNASAFSILGNSKLCGGIVELGLPKCKEIKKHKNKTFPVFVIAILIASTLFIIICLAYAWCNKKNKNQPYQPSMSERFFKVSYNQLLKATNGFSKANLIGNGGFSSVYKGILYEYADKLVAIKVLHLQNRGAERSFMRECEAWQNIRHRNLLKIITAFSTSALDYIHNHCIPSIVHGDIKPSNILLDDDMMAHVGDFCLARFLGTSYQNSSTGIRGTIGYAAPEYGLGNEMTTSGDVYSFGILLLEMMTGKSPTDNIFNEGFSLHKFASMIMPDNVTDVSILNIYQEDGIPVQNNEANVKKIEECLASTIKIGVACTVYYPPERMDIKKVMHELQHTLDTLQNI